MGTELSSRVRGVLHTRYKAELQEVPIVGTKRLHRFREGLGKLFYLGRSHLSHVCRPFFQVW